VGVRAQYALGSMRRTNVFSLLARPYLKCNPVNGPDGTPNLAAPFLCNYGNQAFKGCECARSNRSVGVDPAHHMSLKDCKSSERGPTISCLFGGFWYSTPTAGECTGEAREPGVSILESGPF
jgi:hypothetical protein